MSELAAQGPSAPPQGLATKTITLRISHSEEKETVVHPPCLPAWDADLQAGAPTSH